MPEGRRFSPENPSPTMKSFAEYLRGKGIDDNADLVTTVAATFVYHRDWQQGHAQELEVERAANKTQREADKAKKAEEREAKKAERDANKAKKEAEREAKRKEREAAKAAEGADGDDTPSENGEPGKPRRRLRTKDDSEPVATGVSESSF